MTKHINIFIIYAREDQAYKTELIKALAPLKNSNIIKDFHDGDISPGEKWEDKITEALKNAEVILALVSSDFLSSDYIQNKEFSAAYERHQNEETKLIPIIVRSCKWQLDDRLEQLNVLPLNARPIQNWTPLDEAYTNIVESITPILSEINERRRKEANKKYEEEIQLFEEKVWNETVNMNNLDGYLAYIEKFQPNPRYKIEAHRALEKIRSSINKVLGVEKSEESDEGLFKKYALLIGGVIGLVIGMGISYFGKSGALVGSPPPNEPREWETTLTKGNIRAYKTYLEKFPKGIHINAANDSIAVKNAKVDLEISRIEGVLKIPNYKNDPVTMNDIKNALDRVFDLDPDNKPAQRLKQQIFN